MKTNSWRESGKFEDWGGLKILRRGGDEKQSNYY